MNTDVIAPIVNFTAVVGFLGYFGRKPFADFLKARSESIQKLIEDSQKESKAVFTELATLESLVAGKEAAARTNLEEAKTNLVKFREKTLESATTEAGRIVKEGQMLGQGELAKKRDALQNEISERSIKLAEKFLGEQLESKDREKLVGEYVELVRNGKA